MKKITLIMLTAILAVSMIALAACGGGSLSADASNEKLITITAQNATEDHQITIGSLTVEEGDTVTMTSNLEEGIISVELFGSGEASVEELPEMDGEAVFWADLSPGDSASAELTAGTYMLRITPVEKATGTITVEAAQ